MVGLVLSTAAAAAAAAAVLLAVAATLVLLATPFVVGTFGDLLGVVLVSVDNGFRVGVILAAVVVFVADVPNDVFAAGLCNLQKKMICFR